MEPTLDFEPLAMAMLFDNQTDDCELTHKHNSDVITPHTSLHFAVGRSVNKEQAKKATARRQQVEAWQRRGRIGDGAIADVPSQSLSDSIEFLVSRIARPLVSEVPSGAQ